MTDTIPVPRTWLETLVARADFTQTHFNYDNRQLLTTLSDARVFDLLGYAQSAKHILRFYEQDTAT